MSIVRRKGARAWLMYRAVERSDDYRTMDSDSLSASIDLFAAASVEINEQWRWASGNVVKSFLKQ